MPERSRQCRRMILVFAVAYFCLFAACAPRGGFKGIDRLVVAPDSSFSEDRRVDVRKLGAKIGCEGDTVKGNVKFTRMTVRFREDGVHVKLSYIGEYIRQAWVIPCIRDPLNGVEHIKTFGQYSFRVTDKDKEPAIDFGKPITMGPILDPSHDSNVQTINAVRRAITIAKCLKAGLSPNCKHQS